MKALAVGLAPLSDDYDIPRGIRDQLTGRLADLCLGLHLLGLLDLLDLHEDILLHVKQELPDELGDGKPIEYPLPLRHHTLMTLFVEVLEKLADLFGRLH